MQCEGESGKREPCRPLATNPSGPALGLVPTLLTSYFSLFRARTPG